MKKENPQKKKKGKKRIRKKKSRWLKITKSNLFYIVPPTRYKFLPLDCNFSGRQVVFLQFVDLKEHDKLVNTFRQ